MTVFAVDTHLLLEVIWVSLLVGVGVSALFSLVILGAARASDARRAGEGGAAMRYVALAAVAFAVFAAGVVLGVEAMVSK